MGKGLDFVAVSTCPVLVKESKGILEGGVHGVRKKRLWEQGLKGRVYGLGGASRVKFIQRLLAGLRDRHILGIEN